MLRTSNPALKETTFRGLPRALAGEAMTLQGTVNKTGVSLLILLAAASFVWNSDVYQPFIFIGLIGGLVAALVTIFKNTAAPYTTPVYALFEGLLRQSAHWDDLKDSPENYGRVKPRNT